MARRNYALPVVSVAALVLAGACGENRLTPSAAGPPGGAVRPPVADGGEAAGPAGGVGGQPGGPAHPGGEELGAPAEGDAEGPVEDGEAGGADEPEIRLCPDGSSPSLDGRCPDLVVPEAIAVHEITPISGPVQGGTEVTILGTGFVRPTHVAVAGEPIGIDPMRNATELRFPTPDVTGLTGPDGAPIVGPVDIEISNANGVFVVSGGFTYFEQVAIHSLSSTFGPTTGGDRVQINGAGFRDGMIVTFGGRTAAAVDLVAPDRVQVTTPIGEAGPVDVRVFTDDGAAALPDGYTYVAVVELDSVRPYAGPLEGGTVITLQGAGFTPRSAVRIGPIDAAVSAVSADGTTLTARTPRGDRAGAADVRVVDEGGAALLVGAFSYYDDEDGRVLVHSVVPPFGATPGGELVAVVGQGFEVSTEVRFGGQAARCELRDAHVLECRTPAAQGPGLVDVAVDGAAGQDTLPAGFQYRLPLAVSQVAPASGPVAGATRITVRGTGFDPDTRLTVGVLPAVSVRVLDTTTIVAATPPGSAGPADVAVTRADGVRFVAAGAFQYTDTLNLLGVSPPEGAMPGGTRVSLLGTGFVPGSRVTFDGIAATDVVVTNGATLTAVTPPHDAAVVDVIVTTPGGESATLAGGFTYFNPTTLFGGTWGDPIEGAVNITVLNAATGEPIEGAFCLLGTDRGGDYEGLTDPRGQITFSGDDVRGRQQITCGKQGFSNASVVRFDAENVSVYLFPPPPPPSPGPMGPGPAPATIGGLVWGIDKYLKPLANPEEGWRAVVYVTTTTEDMYEDRRPDPGPGWRVFDDGPYEINSRLGDVAVVAIGGIEHVRSREFRPIRMGAHRWLFGISGQRIEDADIELNIPMENVAGLRFDRPPVGIANGPNWMVVEPTIVMDADGAWPLWQYVSYYGEPIDDGIELPDMPALVNALEDTSLTFRVEVAACDGCNADPRSTRFPTSTTYVRDVRSLADEIDVTPMLGVSRLVDPVPGWSYQDANPIRNNLVEWAIDGGSDLPSAQEIILFRFDADGNAIAFWDLYLRGDATHVLLPEIGEVHGIAHGERIAVLFVSTYIDGFDLDRFEYGDFSIDNVRARVVSLGWAQF